MNISRISVSRKEVWDSCALKYKYQYHLKLKPKEEKFHFTFGKMIHTIAEEYTLCKGDKSIESIAQDVLDGKICIEEFNGEKSFAPKLPAEYKKRFPGMVHSLKRCADMMGFDGYVEYEFNYDLDPPNKKMVNGFIDRLVQKGDKFFILDYKTTKPGKWRKNEETITTDLQLRIYGRIVQKMFNAKPENIFASLVYLEGFNLLPIKMNEHSLEVAEKQLLDAYNQIQEADPETARGNVGEHCFFCDFNDRCPLYKPKQAYQKVKEPTTDINDLF